ncbi:unnamed protein product [Lymnaea stagnalis]|uniref:Endoglucanase n=1 Tax=Lymnaea stagnalis TaxID=6523 RepID=A0AAV2HJ11_LYMST
MFLLTLLCSSVLLLTSPVEGKKNYATALAKSILFYNSQRSGKLPTNNPIPWRGDSSLTDCVVGGWHDAGDHVKFQLPASASTTLLAWSLVQFSAGYQNASQLTAMYDMIKWPLDYFLKAWSPSKSQLVVQVGDGGADHAYWGRPEDMTMARPCKTVSAATKGSDQAAGTAAALAAGSIAFKTKGDTAYATSLLDAAKTLYTFAKANRGVFTGSAEFYSSSGDRDEMCEAAVWLYKASGTASYLTDARSFVETTTAYALSWDDKKAACQALLYGVTKEAQYQTPVVNFFNAWLPGGSVQYTPCGLAWRDQWGATRYAANAAFLALAAADFGIDAAKYRKWGVEQINYILGDNKYSGGCYSFEIGYGTKYPKNPHHRASSCPNKPAACGWNEYNAQTNNPQVLNGALVGGPDVNDNYEDKRSDYIKNEVALDYNAGFQAALAAINSLVAKNALPATANKCPCP